MRRLSHKQMRTAILVLRDGVRIAAVFAVIDVPADVEELHAATRQIAQDLYAQLREHGLPRELNGGVDIFRGIEPGLLMIEEGFLRLSHAGRTVRFFGEGDLVLITGLQPAGTQLAGEFLTHGTWLDAARFGSILATDANMMGQWQSYQDAQFHLMSSICAQYAADDRDLGMKLRKCASGEILMRQGERLCEVLVLIDGRAEVMVDGVCVGDVARGEFIGEMSFLTEAPCAATVVTRQECMLQVIDHESFAAVVRSRPHAMVALARTLAERLARANRLNAESSAARLLTKSHA
jgi:hypothetical protein